MFYVSNCMHKIYKCRLVYVRMTLSNRDVSRFIMDTFNMITANIYTALPVKFF